MTEGENSRGRKKQVELLGSNSESRTVGSVSSVPSLGGQSSEDNSQSSKPWRGAPRRAKSEHPRKGGGDEIEKPWRFRLETRWWKRHPRRERPNRPWKGLGPLPASAPAPFPHPHPPIPAHRDSHLASNWGTPGPHAFAHRVLGWWREWL